MPRGVSRRRRLGFALAALCGIAVAGPAAATAAELTVTTVSDGDECAATCTLRGAVTKAEELGGSNTIVVPAGHYVFDPAQESEPTKTGELRLTNGPGTTLTIKGAGASSTIIDQGQHATNKENDRVILAPGDGKDVIEGVTIEHGSDHEDQAFDQETTRGAGILQQGGELVLVGVRVTANRNNGYGGGVDVRDNGKLTILRSELDNDIAEGGGGGAIALEPGALLATEATFDHDSSGAARGGALNETAGAQATLTNVTIADDGFVESSATYEGGGIYTEGALQMTNVTFHDDLAVGSDGGGGDLDDEGTSPVTFKNVLLDAPVGGEPGEEACTGEGRGGMPGWADEGGNLVADTSCFLAEADMGRVLKLGELGEYGGPAPTVPLLAGSPAIDFGVSGCPATDERGQARVGNCDSGAFEYVPPTSTIVPILAPERKPEGPSRAATEAVLLGCTGRQLVLNDVYIRGSHVLISGSAARSFAGRKVSILFNKGKRVATATVQPNGLFTTTAPLPPAKVRDLLTTRYTAAIGKLRSLNLKLLRRLLLEPPTNSGRTVTLTGRIVLPLTKPLAPLIVEQELECGKPVVVRRLKPAASGRFHITLQVPAGAAAAIYRLKSSVAANRHSLAHGFTTYSLPLPVDLAAGS
jgi:hypothetical protein